MKKKTYNIHSLGCKVNQYDADKLSEVLNKYGFSKKEKESDFSIIFSCSVTQTALRKNRRMINKVRKENQKAKIILAGCWPRVGEVEAIKSGVDLVVDKNNEDGLLDYILGEVERKENLMSAACLTGQSRSRYFIKVQDGCEQFCSYCIIPYARGPLRSRSGPDVMNEISQAVRNGYKEVVLSGIHLGLYGHQSSFQLYDLLQVVISINDIGRVRLSSIELNEINDYILELIRREDRICKHLHVPLQSGNDKILKLMNRPYDTEKFRKRIAKMRRLVPDMAITTDVIVGFPGETKKDFEETKKFIKEIAFSKLHVFPFSAHKRTPAYSMPRQVEKSEINRRAKELRDLSSELEKKYKNGFKGKELDAVYLGENSKGSVFMSEYFFEFFDKHNKYSDDEVGKIFRLKYN